MAAQRISLSKMLAQWETAVHRGRPSEPNEIHVLGDMNVDSMNGRWLDPKYSLFTLGKLIIDFCNAHGFYQLVDQITRAQYNRIKNETAVSCIDHMYSNTKYKVTPVKIISFGGSDHDALMFTRLSREPKPSMKTIRKRSYRDSVESEYIKDVASLDFTDVYNSIDVDQAAAILTAKLVTVLNHHAPWIIYQERKILHHGYDPRLWH